MPGGRGEGRGVTDGCPAPQAAWTCAQFTPGERKKTAIAATKIIRKELDTWRPNMEEIDEASTVLTKTLASWKVDKTAKKSKKKAAKKAGKKR
jgi:hypothetical protein